MITDYSIEEQAAAAAWLRDHEQGIASLTKAAPYLLAACKAFEGFYDGAPDSSTRGMAEAHELAVRAIAMAEAS